MDRSKKGDKQSLFEIYRACRLCGAGGGYKMPIIQNFLQIDGEEVDLKQKIRECLQLEINMDDRMPPLICELCVDKVNDFYEFLNLCKKTNKQTRMRLGLPLKITNKDSATETCMLGLVEASAVKVEPEEPPLKKKKIKIDKDIELIKEEPQKTKSLKEPPKDIKDKIKSKETKPIEKQKPIKDKSKDIKIEKEINESSEKDKGKKETPKRMTRNSLEDLVMTKVQELSKKSTPKAGPKSVKMLKELRELKQMIAHTEEEPSTKLKREELNAKLKREELNAKLKREEINAKLKREELIAKLKREELSAKLKREELSAKLKRSREKDTKELPPPNKKTKPDSKPENATPPKSLPTKPTSKLNLSKKVQPTNAQEKVAKSDKFQCPACSNVLKSNAGFVNHLLHCHPVTWTSDNLACNACREWFPTIEESIAHHKKHTHYKCLKCKKKFRTGVQYHQHIENKKCLPEIEVPDEKCSACCRLFPTKHLLSQHRCKGLDGRLGGKCSKCNRNYTLLKNLKKHESTCTFSQFMKTVEPIIDSEVKDSLLPMEVRISKCDDLLEYGPVVSACTVPHRYGLDSKRSYPYMPELRVIKKTPVVISTPEQDSIEFGPADLEWDDFLNARTENSIKKLSTLSLKVLFSENMLGDKIVLDEEDYKKRLSLKRKIDSIIFKYEDSNSCDSNSILDKNVVSNFENVISGSEDAEKNDSTGYDEIASCLKSNDDTLSGEILFDDLRFNNIDQNNDNGFENDGVDSQIDASAQKNDIVDSNKSNLGNDDDDVLRNRSTSRSSDVGSRENYLSNQNGVDSQNNGPDDSENCNNGDAKSQNDDCESKNDEMACINDDSLSNEVTCNDNENYETVNHQTNSHKNTLNISNIENNSDKIGLGKYEDIVISENNQKTASNENNYVNSDQNDTDTNIVSQNDMNFDVNNDKIEVDMVEKNQSTINNTNKSNTTNTINQTDPNAPFTENETDSNLHDKNNQNSTIDETDSAEKEKSLNKNLQNIDNISTSYLSSLPVKNTSSTSHNTKVIENDGTITNIHDLQQESSVNKSENIELNKNIVTETMSTEDIATTDHFENNISDSKTEIRVFLINTEFKDKQIDQNRKNNLSDNHNNNHKNDVLKNELEIVDESSAQNSKSEDNNFSNDSNHYSNLNSKSDNNDPKNENILSKSNDNDTSVDISNKNDKKNDSPTKNTNFSITSILNNDNSNPDENAIKSTETDSTKYNDLNNKYDISTEKQNDNFPDNISFNEATDDSLNTKENDRKNDKNNDSLSLNSLKFIDASIDIDKIDKFNVNDLSEDEKRLMAELDEQIGENNDKTDFDAISDNYDFNV